MLKRINMKINAAHILVETLEQAEEIKKYLANGANFAALAQQFSKCPSGRDGGNLGFFGRGQMVKEFDEAVHDMDVGTISDPVKTQFGYHIIYRLY